MGRKVETREIGRHQYVITQFGATQARQNMMRIAKIISLGGVGAARGLTTEEGIAMAAERIFNSIEMADVDALIDDFKACTSVRLRTDPGNVLMDPIPLAQLFEEHFADQIMDQLEWIAACVEVNYANFIRDAQGPRLASLLSRVSSFSKSPQASPSIGQSTGSP